MKEAIPECPLHVVYTSPNGVFVAVCDNLSANALGRMYLLNNEEKDSLLFTTTIPSWFSLSTFGTDHVLHSIRRSKIYR